MSIEDGHEGVPGLSQLDPIYSYIVVIVNVCPTAVSFANPALLARTFELHPIQAMSTDEFVKNSTYESLTGSFTVPSRTTSVFVEPRNIWGSYAVKHGCLIFISYLHIQASHSDIESVEFSNFKCTYFLLFVFIKLVSNKFSKKKNSENKFWKFNRTELPI